MGNPSVKLHHNPGGKSNFSLAQTGERMEEDERFNIIKPGVSQPFGKNNYEIDETYHQKTGQKNQSQIAFGNNNDNAFKEHDVGGLVNYTRHDDARYPRKKGNFGNEDYSQYNQPNAPNSWADQQSSPGFVGGQGMSMRDRYLQEKQQQQQ